MKIVDAKSLEAVYTHTIHLLNKVSLLNIIHAMKLCLLKLKKSKFNNLEETEKRAYILGFV